MRSPSREHRRAAPLLWGVALGAAAGLVTWLYDYDFLLNAGGPETPISNAILRATGTASAPASVFVLWPAVALVLLGMAGGFLVSWMFALFRRQATKYRLL